MFILNLYYIITIIALRFSRKIKEVRMKKLTMTLFLLLILTNTFVYYSVEYNATQKIQLELDKKLQNLKIHYNVLLRNQRVTADAIYVSTVKFTPNFIELFSQVQTATKEKKALLREKLYQLFKNKYRVYKMQGVLQYHLVLPNNESFLRMHKVSKFGDDLSTVRKDFYYVNTTHKLIRGFTQGRTSHAFRNVYPIFGKKHEYLGAIEISFSSDSFQDYLTNISKIHTHFLVSKSVFKANTWKRDDLVLRYKTSGENSNFMLAMNRSHTVQKCIVGNAKKLQTKLAELSLKMQRGKAFSLYIKRNSKEISTVSFFPIKSLDKKKTLAWLVAYEKSDFIYETLNNKRVVTTLFLLFSLVVAYLLYREFKIQNLLKEKMKSKAYLDGLTGVYNRNKFDEAALKELKRDERYKRNLSMAIVDIDHFKNFNDKYGHLVGDEVLIMIAHYLNASTRGSDIFARWGGEEFVILFPETVKEDARELCEELRQGVSQLSHEKAGSVTVSFGITQYMQGDSLQSMFKRCDDALYKAKESGRNRVCFI